MNGALRWYGYGIVALCFCVLPVRASDVWTAPAFSADAASLCKSAESIKAGKHDEATVLLNDVSLEFDSLGRVTETRHLIFRVESQDGVENWAEVSGRWAAWHELKPEIKARVITNDGVEHWLDPKTLTDLPVHQNVPDTYSDEHRFGGPLPALAPGVIVEQQVITRDTAPLFTAGQVERWGFAWSVPVHESRFVIKHPISLTVHYEVHLLPKAVINKSSDNGFETISVEQGPLRAFTENFEHVPSDVVVFPEIELSTGESWRQVAAEYSRLTEDKVRTADVQNLLAKVNLKAPDRLERIRRIVSVLHKNVRYTGIEFGESSLIPQFPVETVQRRYGDCKDKALLLVTMLRAAGIPAKLALLDAGPGRDINRNLPGMGMFDHAIVFIPAAGDDPELWVDATAQLVQVGTLPWMDYGRWALIIADDTQSLKQIPELTADQNVHREQREFTLAEYGSAKIVESNDEIGPEDADYREYYAGDSKEVREQSENYVKETYLADSLTSLDHGDLFDLEKPGTVKFVTTGRRGTTDLTNSLVAIRLEALFDSLPKYFKVKEEAPKANADDPEASPRTADWSITPFTTEWDYKVVAPLGFKLRALPPDKTETVGVLTFTQKYFSNGDGTVVNAVLRVRNDMTRLTVQQANDLRDAVVKARTSDPVFITFDNVANSLIAAGNIKDGLATYRRVAAQHPTEALHKVQLAHALLSAGLGEQARTVALQATQLEPKSALAFSTLANTLKYDLIGRLEKKGMDYDGAVAAYRKALTLDPKDKETRVNLALLLEFDANGIRYSEKARLKDAVAEFRELKKTDEDYAREYDDNVLYDLWYARDFQGVLDYASTLPASETRKGLIIAAIAGTLGSDAALKKSLEITTDNQERSKVLVTAGAVLVRVRKYPEGAAMFTEGARGQGNESQLMRSASIFSKAQPYETLKSDPNDPRSVIQKMFGDILSGRMTLDEFHALTFDINVGTDPREEAKQFSDAMSKMQSQLESAGLPAATLADITLSNMHYTVDGDDSIGYKVIVESPGAAAQDLYVIRDANQYKVAGVSMEGDTETGQLCLLALRELDRDNLVAARKWLDRARDRSHITGGDDPLAGAIFPHFWTKGQEANAATIRIAAVTGSPYKAVKGPYLEALKAARSASTNDMDRARLTLALGWVYYFQDQWSDVVPLAEELMKNFPTSLQAFGLGVDADARLGRLDDWDKLVQARRRAYPDELMYVRSASRLEIVRKQFAKSREITKTIIDKGQANEQDLNLYAWYALYLSNAVDQDAIDTAVRANDLSKNADFNILHTLACVYAEAGKTSQAREILLKAIDAAHLTEPNDAVWLALGMLAEQYGENEAAQKMFQKVQKPKFDDPGSSYQLAQQHLTLLNQVVKASAKIDIQ